MISKLSLNYQNQVLTKKSYLRGRGRLTTQSSCWETIHVLHIYKPLLHHYKRQLFQQLPLASAPSPPTSTLFILHRKLSRKSNLHSSFHILPLLYPVHHQNSSLDQ